MNVESEILDLKKNIQDILVVQANHENRIKVSEHRVDDLEGNQSDIKDMCVNIERLACSTEQIAKGQEKLTEEINKMAEKQETDRQRISEIENRPYREKAKKHDNYVFQIVVLIGSIILTYFFTKFGA